MEEERVLLDHYSQSADNMKQYTNVALSLQKRIRVTRMEERPDDAWYDFALRQLRRGEVRFYRVRDFLTGDWLFKTCTDKEIGKVLVKAVKCPPGARFSQLEGNTMVFQRSTFEGMLYDIISLTRADEKDQLSRKVVDQVEEVPAIIRENYKITPYEEATGKRAPGKHWVTLTSAEDEKALITLFLLERAWTLSRVTPEERIRALEREQVQKQRVKVKEIDTGHVWTCPICGSGFQFLHVEREQARTHKLKKQKKP